MRTYPEALARFYDIIYARVRDAVDKRYYVDKLTSRRGPSLEVGVGTGRIFLEALRQGADVYGLDSSPTMISVLRGKLEAQHHHRVRECDLVTMSLRKRFDLIIAPFRVLSHIIGIDDQIRALNAVHDHLNPGGTFIFDIFVPDLKMLREGLPPTVDFDGEYAPGRHLKRVTSAVSDLITQITSVTMTLSWDDEAGPSTAEWLFPMRFFFRYELEHLIARSKLRLQAMYGDFNESPLDSTSREFLVHCVRE